MEASTGGKRGRRKHRNVATFQARAFFSHVSEQIFLTNSFERN